MIGILIRIKPGHQMDGEGESLGNDLTGEPHTFWRSAGQMEVPIDVAIRLEGERPQRFEMLDRRLVELLNLSPKEEEPIPEEPLTLKKLKEMTKDAINDWAAKRDYDVKASDRKTKIISDLISQIEQRTGKKVE